MCEKYHGKLPTVNSVLLELEIFILIQCMLLNYVVVNGKPDRNTTVVP